MKQRNTIGMNMGDRSHSICILGPVGEVVSPFELRSLLTARQYEA